MFHRLLVTALVPLFSRRLAERTAFFPDAGGVRTPVYEGGSMPPGHRLTGPALIAEPTTTVVVPPEVELTVTELGDYLLEPR